MSPLCPEGIWKRTEYRWPAAIGQAVVTGELAAVFFGMTGWSGQYW